MNIKIIIRIHDFIQNGKTGNPKEFCKKIGVSERTLYNYIAFMKQDLKAPIIFNTYKRSYEYVSDCKLRFFN